MRRLLLCASLAGTALSAGAQPAPITRREALDSTRRELRRLDDAAAFSGVVLLATKGEVELHSAHGLAQKGDGIPNRPNTAFNLASVGKLFTSVVIGQLVAEGRLHWTDSVAKLLPEYRGQPFARGTTIEHLLTHRSGLGLYWEQLFAGNWTQVRTSADVVNLFARDTLLSAPGTAWHYSNAGFAVLALVVERVTGKDFASVVRERVFAPAGMSADGFTPLDEDVPNRATGYFLGDDNRLRNNLFTHTVVGGGAGGSWASAPDLLRFMRAFNAGTLVDTAIVTAMTTRRTDTDGHPAIGHGYGFMVIQTRGRTITGHTGGFAGIAAYVMMDRERDRVAIVLSNEPERNVSRVWEIARLYLQAID